MFKESHAFSSFSVNNVAKAKAFYDDVLGLEIKEEYGGLSLMLADGGRVMVYPKGDDHQAANFTVLNFPVGDIEKTVDELSEKGVKFEHYDFMKTDERGLTPVDSQPRMAWFKDPAGNIISLIQI